MGTGPGGELSGTRQTGTSAQIGDTTAAIKSESSEMLEQVRIPEGVGRWRFVFIFMVG